MSKKSVKKIGLLTGGGDCPGINAVIRAVVKTAINDYGLEVIGFKDGYYGLLKNLFVKLGLNDASGILTLGGTILGTSNTDNPFRVPVKKRGEIVFQDLSHKCLKNYQKNNLDALICIGGDGSLNIAYKLFKKGLNIIGVPKTIDNDLKNTDLTFGFDSAVATATEAIDKLHSTAQSHHRVMVIEVMGRYAGWLALYSGLAGGGDIILIPEIPYGLDEICRKVEERNKKGKRFSIIVVAEGARPKGGGLVVREKIEKSTDPLRLGGIGQKVAADIAAYTNLETRFTVLGHLQRGGTPTAFDRVLSTRLGREAVVLAVKKKFGSMVSLRGQDIIGVNLKDTVGNFRPVPLNSHLISCARSLGVSLGDGNCQRSGLRSGKRKGLKL